MKPAATLACLLALAPLASGITVCHDYAFYRASQMLRPKGKDLNGLSPTQLKSRLRFLGYQRVAALSPGDTADLKRGDVVVIGSAQDGQAEDHSGVVVDDDGHLDHFIQDSATQGVVYTPSEAEQAYDARLKTPLVRRGWTIADLRERKRTVNGVKMDSIYKHKTFQVFRRKLSGVEEVNVWVLDPRFSEPPSGPKKDGSGQPLCTDSVLDMERGRLTYKRSVDGASLTFTLDFVPVPKVILEGEEVHFWSRWAVQPTTTAALTDEALLHASIPVGGRTPASTGVFVDKARHRLRTSLADPERALVKLKGPDGKFVPDAPPFEGSLWFDWPELDPAALVPYRYVNFGTTHYVVFGRRYVQLRMTLKEAEEQKSAYDPL